MTALKAVGLLLLAILCFDAMSVMIRTMIRAGYSAQELSAYRNLFGVLPSLLLMIRTGELRLKGTNLYIPQWRLAVLRGLVVALAQVFFFSAIGLLDLATVSALGQTSGLFVVALSVMFLKERVGIWRWSALAIGFGGAMLILQPGSDAFTAAALLPICAAACYSFSMITVRKFDRTVSNALLYLYSSGAAAVGAILLAAITTEFSAIASIGDAAFILTLALIGGTGVLLMMLAYRMAAPSILAPFGYFGLVTSFSFGWYFFGEFPVETLFPGVLLIVAGGAMVLWRENRRA
ncbi:MAG: DMT family transporter [Rhodobacteraceae bacterium]|nr:DMT family transporter [Paracoccaceae bacterium]